MNRPLLTKTSIQFFGDLYIPQKVLGRTTSGTGSKPAVFSATENLLSSADINVVNFEGALTQSRFPASVSKTHHLRMPPALAQVLRHANIQVATLANNHAMDFGFMGLFDSISILEENGIQTLGAGSHLADALKPVIIPTPAGSICILAFSRTLPESFWAKDTQPGTANLDYLGIRSRIKRCALENTFTFVSFHWGAEMTRNAKNYQKELARLAIDAGADAVIGHHPHVLQEIIFYKGKPILFSLGNFAFGTVPRTRSPEGMAVKFELRHGGGITKATLTPLNVNNPQVNFVPRPLKEGESDPIRPRLAVGHPCEWQTKKRHWECRFPRK